MKMTTIANIITASWKLLPAAVGKKFGMQFTYQTEINGLKIIYDADTLYVLVAIFGSKEYEPTKKLGRMHWLDIGANYGHFCLYLEHLRRRGVIGDYTADAYEPCNASYQKLIQNLSANKLPITAHKSAITDRAGETLLYYNSDCISNSLKAKSKSSETVNSIAAARVFEGNYDGIKCDAEGSEKEIFMSTDKWKSAKYIMVEIHEGAEGVPSHIQEQGYELLKKTGHSTYHFAKIEKGAE